MEKMTMINFNKGKVPMDKNQSEGIIPIPSKTLKKE